MKNGGYKLEDKDTTSTTSTTSESSERRENTHSKEARNEKKDEKYSNKEKQKIITKTKGWIGDYFVESILYSSEPHFLCYNKKEGISIKKEIEYNNTKYLPLRESQQGYIPYSFTPKELAQWVENPPTKEALLDYIESLTDKYLVLDEIEKRVVLGDILLSYSQEWIDTVHYLYFVGDNGSGKSSCCQLFRWLGYRCLYSEDISPANIYNFLGTDEEGAGTIVEDEAHELDYNSEKLRIYKNGYTKGSTIPKMFMGKNSKDQRYYKSFCFKVFGGERIPKNKGFKQRLIVIHTIKGTPKSYIKQPKEDEKNELLQLRKKLLFWKVSNAGRRIQIVDSGFDGRDKELWDGFLSCVYDTRHYEKCKKAAEYYVENSKETIRNSLEAIIFKKICRLNKDLMIVFEDLWIDIINNNAELLGETNPYSSNTFYPREYEGHITRNSLSKMLEEKFKAKKITSHIKKDDKKHKITFYKFSQEVIGRLSEQYLMPISSPSSL